MRYYKAVDINEHMLYAKEFAASLGIHSLRGKPHNKMVKYFLEEIRTSKGDDCFYYETKHGLAQVYPREYCTDLICKLRNDSKILHGYLRTIRGAELYTFSLDGDRYA